jgi:hypothetical protein
MEFDYIVVSFKCDGENVLLKTKYLETKEDFKFSFFFTINAFKGKTYVK